MSKFSQPVDAIRIVKKAPVRSPLTPDAVAEGQRRVKNGEDPTLVARDLLRELRTLGGPGSGTKRAARAASTLESLLEWNEEDHPRAEDGKFTDKGGEPGRDKPALKGSDVDVNEVKLALARIAPEALIESTAKQIAIVVPDMAAAERIDAYLEKHYGFDLRGQAESIVDRDRGEVITTKKAAPAAVARTLESRFLSQEWKDAIKNAPQKVRDLGGEDAMAALITLFGEHGVLTAVDPIAIGMEALVDVMKGWGWL